MEGRVERGPEHRSLASLAGRATREELAEDIDEPNDVGKDLSQPIIAVFQVGLRIPIPQMTVERWRLRLQKSGGQ